MSVDAPQQTATPTRVLIVDDHPVFRNGLAILLDEMDPDVIVDQAGSIASALEFIIADPPINLVLLDLNLPDGTGSEVLQRVSSVFEGVPIAILSAIEEPRVIRKMIDGGASGYIPKTTDPNVIVNALRLILDRGTYLPPSILEYKPGDDQGAEILNRMTQRQLEAFRLLCRGQPNKKIAITMAISVSTVKAHLDAVYAILRVNSRTEAVFRAHELRLFDLIDARKNAGGGNTDRGS